MRAAVALGLVIALIVVPVMPPGALPAIAQDEESEEQEPAAPPSRPSAPKPSGPGPAFSPSGAGTGTGTSTGPGTGSGTSQPAPQSAGGFSPAPPPLGAVTYENALKDDKVFPAGRCFGGLGMGQYVGEGFKMWLRGRCILILDDVEMSVASKGVNVGDGEVALDFKLVDGAERAIIGLYVRNINERSIGTQIHAARGEASLFTMAGSTSTDLAYRGNIVIPPYEWNRLALRVSGHNVWLLINDEPVLHSAEVPADAGSVILELVREGNPDDENESAVVFRNLTMTALDGGEPDRAPRGP